VTPGQQHESTQAAKLLNGVAVRGKPGPPRTRFGQVAGDKAYDSAPIRTDIRSRGSEPVIPHRKRPDGSYPPSAEGFDKCAYRRRNVIERLNSRLKEFRRIATRYDKLLESFKAFVLLGFIMIWLKDLFPYTP
jgi:transposase